MLIRKPSDIPSSSITSKESVSESPPISCGALSGIAAVAATLRGRPRSPMSSLPRIQRTSRHQAETVKSPSAPPASSSPAYEDITHYNNFYEFGVERAIPRRMPAACPRVHGP